MWTNLILFSIKLLCIVVEYYSTVLRYYVDGPSGFYCFRVLLPEHEGGARAASGFG